MALGLLPLVPVRADQVSDVLNVLDPSGDVACSVSVSEADELTNDFLALTAGDCNVSSLVDVTQYGNPTYLMEPDGTISDIFGVSFTEAKTTSGPEALYSLAFFSDVESVKQPALPTKEFGVSIGSQPFMLDEGSGGPFDATQYLDPSLRTAGWAAQFTSDADVPEPAGAGILCGLVALGLCVWRRVGHRRRE